jgi:hypothetical protein
MYELQGKELKIIGWKKLSEVHKEISEIRKQYMDKITSSTKE